MGRTIVGTGREGERLAPNPGGPVLLVEDDVSDFRLIQRAFAKIRKGVPMIRLSHGDEAVAYLAGDAPYENRSLHPFPCVILLDIKLPRRSGFEVLEWIRTQESALKRLPIIMLTSSSHQVDVNKAYDLGVNSYLVKPSNSSELEQLMSTFQTYWLESNAGPPGVCG
ncbi:MAG: response regulator [Candidatus Angelobacter sp.]